MSENGKKTQKKEYPTEYDVFKRAIVKSASRADLDRQLSFKIDPDKLDEFLADQNIVVLRKNLESREVKVSDIPFLSEYFVKQRLSWFNEARDFAVFVLVKTTDQENPERLEELLAILNNVNADGPEIDEVTLVSELIANYKCYFATTVSYISNDPQSIGKLMYSIVCRANKVSIADERYKYNPGDMS